MVVSIPIKKTIVALASQTLALVFLPGIASAASFRPEEATVGSIQSALGSGTSCTSITQAYLDRIQAYDDQGPALNAIISINPNALAIAADLDARYAQSGPIGSLHCVPYYSQRQL
jgi:hypothetical protein